MEMMLPIAVDKLPVPIAYTDKLLLIGSCFTEHISERLAGHKFLTLSNPHGILFNPLSVASSLAGYATAKSYGVTDLFFLNELWNSWDHHTRFSDIDREAAIEKIQSSQRAAVDFIRQANWIIITLGSSFQYYLIDGDRPVANNHRAPAQWFEKRLLSIDHIVAALGAALDSILRINPSVKFLFTVSPVRHIRDGVVDNNRSKARLLEAVHTLCERFDSTHYFPAYEMVIDILRDYRFYDVDFVHPNYLATQFVWQKFSEVCFSPQTRELMDQVRDIMIARSHRPRFPDTAAHRKFKSTYAQKIVALQQAHPFIDLNEELQYFST